MYLNPIKNGNWTRGFLMLDVDRQLETGLSNNIRGH